MKNIFNKAVIVITGGASGIGLSLANQLGSLGAQTIVVDRDGGAGVKRVDMVNIPEVEKLFVDIIKQYGRIDYIFNNAGIFMAGEIRDTPIEDWHKVVDNNIWAVYNGAHFAYQQMLKQGKGHIINVASAAGLFPTPIMGIYGSSKFSIVGFTHALRNEAKDLGVKVSVVCPTVVNTPLYDTAIYHRVNKSKVLKTRDSLQTPDEAARKIIKGVIRNKATIHTAFSTKLGWFAYKYIPFVYNLSARRIIVNYRKTLRLKK